MCSGLSTFLVLSVIKALLLAPSRVLLVLPDVIANRLRLLENSRKAQKQRSRMM